MWYWYLLFNIFLFSSQPHQLLVGYVQQDFSSVVAQRRASERVKFAMVKKIVHKEKMNPKDVVSYFTDVTFENVNKTCVWESL